MRFEESYREIANRAEIPGRSAPNMDIFKVVSDWLRDDRNGAWFLILDSIDDTRWLCEARQTTSESGLASGTSGHSKRPISEYLPQSHDGSILITSRTKSIARKLVEDDEIINVEPMDEAEAVTLLEKKLETLNDRSDIAELVAALDFMPLAVVQAAAYIRQRGPRCSVRQYIGKFKKTDKSRTSLLNHEAGHLRRDGEAKNSILTTWLISFDHLYQTRRSAADLLSLMCFFDRNGIPEYLI